MMTIKKPIKIFAIATAMFFAAALMFACSDPGAPDVVANNPVYAVSANEIESEFDLFMQSCKDRTSFTQKELDAAQYIRGRLVLFGYTDAVIKDFSATESGVSGLIGHNVVTHYQGSQDADAKNVIIGAYYDNRYSAAYTGAEIYKSDGALAGGTSVAALLRIANYLMSEKPQLGFNVTVAFFGGSCVSTAGADAFLKDMTGSEYQNTVLMIEMQRLGVDHVYAFSDVRPTARETFFDGISEQNGLNIYKVTQKSPLMNGVSTLKGIPYYQWAHNGVFGVFFNENIPTLNIVGANWETVDFKDAESKDNDNICFTESDNSETVKQLYPDFAQKAAAAVSLVIHSLESKDFLTAMEYDRENFPNTDILTVGKLWYAIVLCVMMVAAIIMIIVCAIISKKHKQIVSPPIKMKIAVFGVDYEDKNSGDIFFDLRNSSATDDIFPGISNNSGNDDGIVDGIFPLSVNDIQSQVCDASDKETTEIGEQSDAHTDDVNDVFGLDDGIAPAKDDGKKVKRVSKRRSEKKSDDK